MNRMTKGLLLLAATTGASLMFLTPAKAATTSAKTPTNLTSQLEKVTANDEEKPITGNYGDVSYKIENQVVTLSGGTLKPNDNMFGLYAWNEYPEYGITKIIITGPLTIAGDAGKYLFGNMPKLTTIEGLSYLDTSQTTSMASMFSGDESLTSLDLSTLKTGNVIDMSGMFAGDSKLTSLKFTNWNTSKVNKMNDMFMEDIALPSLDVSGFNTSHVFTMENMFGGNVALTSLNLGNFDTRNVETMAGMFIADSALKWLNVSSFDTPTVEDVNRMFAGASSLKTLNLAKMDLSQVTKPSAMEGLFAETSSLSRLILGPKVHFATNIALGSPAGGTTGNWQAVNSEIGGTLSAPKGTVYSVANLIGHYGAAGVPVETYVPEKVMQDQSAITVKPELTLPIGGEFNPKDAFISAVTPEGRTTTNLDEAIADGLIITGSGFNPNTAGQHKVGFSFSGSDKVATTLVTINPNGGNSGGGNVTPPTLSPTPAPQPTPTPAPQPTPPTIPGYVTKKKAAVYALKAVYLYKNPTFKKNQRLVKYNKQKRVNRPMFVVIDYARSSNGTLHYKVRDVNHDRKSDGKIGYITANWKYVRGVYYQSVPKNKTITIISKKGVHAYRNKNLTGRVKSYKKGTHLTVKKLVKHNLTTRYLLSNGLFVTANKKLVIQGQY